MAWEHFRKGVLVVGALGLSFLAVMVYQKSVYLPPCVMREWTGLHCPGCGVTRAARALLHGNVLDSFRYNPLAVILLPAILYGMGHELAAWAWRMPEWRMKVGSRWAVFLAVLVIGFGVLRNVPGLDFLRPK